MAVTTTWHERLSRLFTVSLSELTPFRRPPNYVSLDIGSSSIKLVEVRAMGASPEIVRWGSAPTPPAAIQNSMVVEPERLGGVVRELLDRHAVGARYAVTAVPGPAVMIKRMTVPAQGAIELEGTVLAEATSFIPEDPHNVSIDYQIVDHREASKQLEVVLVVAKKDIVESYAATLRAAGVVPMVVDVDYFALDNMYALNYGLAADRVVALVNIGARYSSVNILKGGRSTFTGDVPVGGRDITDALARELGVPAAVAEELKTGRTTDGPSVERVADVLRTATDALIEEIYYALSFFWTAASDEHIDALYLSGGAARTPELCRRLSERVAVPVAMADPLARIAVTPAIDAVRLRQRAPEFAIAVGLALRRPGDK